MFEIEREFYKKTTNLVGDLFLENLVFIVIYTLPYFSAIIFKKHPESKYLVLDYSYILFTC